MNADRIYGPGRTAADMRGVFMPRGMDSTVKIGDLLATFKGFGAEGKGREQGLDLLERMGVITSDQRAAAAAGMAADGAGAAAAGATSVNAAGAAGAATATGAGAGAAAATGTGAGGAGAAMLTNGSRNPIYNGLYAQMMMREQGIGMPVGAAGAADDAARVVADAPLASVADDAADALVASREQLVARFRQIGELPLEARVPTLAAAVDATAAAGAGDDAFAALTRTLLERPPGATIGALDDAIAATLRTSSPLADDAVRAAAPLLDDVATKAAPLLDDVAVKAVPLLDDAARAGARSLLPLADDALRTGLAGAMSFSAAIDDTLRLLVRLR